MNIKFISIILLFIFINSNLQSSDKKLEEILEIAKNDRYDTLNINQRTVKIAKQFEDVPYKGGTLEGNNTERCVINTEQLDCVTFYENVMAIANTINSSSISTANIYNNLINTRYRNGKLDGYLSRLHYTKEWITDNEKRNNIKNISKELGGVILPNKVNILTRFAKNIPKLKGRPDSIKVAGEIEKRIDQSVIYYIPKDKVKSISHKIRSGDIIAITSNKKGFDFNHTGIAYRDNNRVLRLFHASTTHKKVLIDIELYKYLNKVKSHSGICVLRPLEQKTKVMFLD